MLNYFIFFGNRVKCLIKCRHYSLIFFHYLELCTVTECKYEEHSSFLCQWCLRAAAATCLPHSHCSL